MRILLFSILLIFVAMPAYTQETVAIDCNKGLTGQDVERVKANKELLTEVEDRSVQKILDDFERTDCPVIHTLMMEAMSRTYLDLIQKYEVQQPDVKRSLYSKINLNMAFLQFTGGMSKGDNSSLNRVIRRKLKYYLPANILTHPGFYQSVE